MCPPVRRRVFRPGYAADLVTAWLPALDGVVAKLDHATVADEPSIHAAWPVKPDCPGGSASPKRR
ncbi:hypothetical protein [Amycolatopsis sp. ATCC 39116]|uniref:hypothetical protein n=1 Tax=Amycolatopsis sp. (strain ATCC 39116 / 75iv2) TaxID=385957 RepID=UPI0002F5ECE8|nr:hypothetical protein [Amycolatopsis sp. ATCC 39116]